MLRSWTFDDEHYQAGVDLQGDTLSWWGQPKGPMGRFSGGGCDQTTEDFVRRGPAVRGVPDAVLRELLAALGHESAPWLPSGPVR